MDKSFQSLIDDFCTTAKLPKPSAIAAGGPFQNQGVAFAFRYDKGRPDSVMLFTDFGPMPERRANLIYRVLLEENFIDALTGGSAFGLQEKTGNIVYAEKLALDGLSTKSLFRRMALRTAQALEWRVSHFIDDDPEKQTKYRAPGAGWLNLHLQSTSEEFDVR